MKVFFDTGVFISLFIEADINHEKVTEKYREYHLQRSLFFTSYYILDEFFTRLIYDFGKNIAEERVNKLMLSIERQEVRLLGIDETIFNKSLEIFFKFSEHKISFTDATTYVLYKDFAIDELFTLDSDFKKIRARTSF